MIAGKKGEGIRMLLVLIIILIVNIVFFAGMFYIVERSGSRPGVYEELYAKKIALLIDNSDQNTAISLNINELERFLDENKLDVNKAFIIKDNKVFVKLNDNFGYGFYYFSDYDVEISSHREGGGELFVDILIKERPDD